MFPILFVLMLKKPIQQIGLEHGLFYHIVKMKRTIIGESDMDFKKKKKPYRSILKFEGQSARSKSIFLLQKTGLKITSRQEHWVGHSVIKPVDAVDAQKIKATR